jgi:hypothetical protein
LSTTQQPIKKHFVSYYQSEDKMAGQAGLVRQIQAMEDATDNQQITVVAARNRIGLTGLPGLSDVGSPPGAAASLVPQSSQGTNS